MVRKLVLLSLVCICLASPAFESSQNLEDTDGPWSYLGVTGYSGTITMNALTKSSLFYWLFESIGGDIATDSTPLIIWLQGGPGCSGGIGMFWANISPLTIYPNYANVFPTNLNYTWATDFHILSVDFPYGAGFSTAYSAGDEKNSTLSATLYLYNFLIKLARKYPTWFQREIYVFGESYGGHWVPGLVFNILQQNALNLTGITIPVVGMGLGDPWTDPMTQSQTYSLYAHTFSLINYNQMNVVNYYQSQVSQLLSQQNYLQAEYTWENSYSTIVDFAGGINYYNIRLFGDYNFDTLTNWLNKAGMKTIFHAPSTATWNSCNNTVYDYYRADIMNSTLPLVNYILSQGVKVIIYNGQDDLIVNAPGIENMVQSINYPNFAKAPKQNWIVNDTMAGYVQTAGNLTLALVLRSGHVVPHDQPVVAKDLVLRFVNNLPWNE